MSYHPPGPALAAVHKNPVLLVSQREHLPRAQRVEGEALRPEIPEGTPPRGAGGGAGGGGALRPEIPRLHHPSIPQPRGPSAARASNRPAGDSTRLPPPHSGSYAPPQRDNRKCLQMARWPRGATPRQNLCLEGETGKWTVGCDIRAQCLRQCRRCWDWGLGRPLGWAPLRTTRNELRDTPCQANPSLRLGDRLQPHPGVADLVPESQSELGSCPRPQAAVLMVALLNVVTKQPPVLG